MARPFLFVGAAALLASFLVLFSGIITAVFFLILTVLFVTVLNIAKKQSVKKTVLIAVIFVILIIRFIALELFVHIKTENLMDKTVKICGRITGISYSSESFTSYTLKITEASIPSACGLTAKADSFSSAQALPGDLVSAEVVFVKCSQEFKQFNFSKGNYFFCDIDKIRCEKQGKYTFYRMIYNVRNAVSDTISTLVSGEAGAVLKAFVIGDTIGISDEFSENVKAAGVSHMLVVSGMHLGIVCGVLMNILRRRTKRWVTAVVGTLFALFITAICLFHVSILRASIAYFVMLIGRKCYRCPDGLSSLGVAGLVAVLITPYVFYNVAFQLSMAATFAVIYPANMLIKTFNIRKKGILWSHLKLALDILIISVSATICTLPITVHNFGYVALAAPITNLLVNLAVTCALVLGVIAVSVNFVPIIGRICCVPLILAAGFFASYFANMVNFIGKSGFGVVNIPQNKNIYCFFITIAFILLVRILYKNKMKKEEMERAQRQNSKIVAGVRRSAAELSDSRG